MPNLAELEIIASDTPTRTVTLSGISVTVLFSALDAANRLYDWQGMTFELSQAEIDRIDEILGGARHELMQSQIGEIKLFAIESIPPNYLFCDGSIYDESDYPALYSVLPATFIIDSATFRVPDLRSKFVQASVSNLDIGEEGGEEEITLSLPQIPSHAHTIPSNITTLALEPGEVTVLTPLPLIDSYTGESGGNEAHSNIPPFMKLLYCIVAL